MTPKWYWRLGALACIAMIGWLDYATGPILLLGPLYLLPVVAIAWRFGGWYPAFEIVVSATIVWFLADMAYIPERWARSMFNASTRFLMFGSVGWTVSKLKDSEERLQFANTRLQGMLTHEATMARTDSLTGLLNRYGFEECCRIELARARRSGRATGLIYVDLDNFKSINDRFGHDRGDTVLKAVAASVVASVRETDVCARLGGDEFAVFCWNATPEALQTAADRIAEHVKNLMPNSGLGASAGVVWFESPPEDTEKMLSRGDHEMYRTKLSRKKNL